MLDALASEYGHPIVEPDQKETITRTIESYPPLHLTPSLMIQLVEQLSGVKLPSSPNHQDIIGSSSDELVPDGSALNGGFDSRQRSGGMAGSAPSAWNKRPLRMRGRSENITVRDDGTVSLSDSLTQWNDSLSSHT